MSNIEILAVFGSRSLDDERVTQCIAEAIKTYAPRCIITAGQATGVCKRVREFCADIALPLKLEFLDKKRAAGQYHYRAMAILNACDYALFIHDGKSTRTQNAIALAKKIGKPFTIKLLNSALTIEEDRGPMNQRKAYKFNAQRRAAFLALIARGGRRHATARAVGIDPSTVCLHIQTNPVFRAQLELAECEADDEIEDALRKTAREGNVIACLAWLYSRQPGRWRDTRKIEQTIAGAGGGPLVIEYINNWRDETITGEFAEVDSTPETSSGTANGHAITGSLEMVSGGSALAEIHDGDGDSSRTSTEGP